MRAALDASESWARRRLSRKRVSAPSAGGSATTPRSSIARSFTKRSFRSRRFRRTGFREWRPRASFDDGTTSGVVEACEWENALEALAPAHLVSMSEDDHPAPEELAEQFPGRAFAVTKGKEGARIYSQGDIYDLPAFAAFEVDPTGAGDVYAAAFLLALRERRPVAAGRPVRGLRGRLLGRSAGSRGHSRERGGGSPPRGGPMKDEALIAYCERVEREFFRHKGRPGTLSPKDFARAEEWYRAEVPIETAIAAIDAAFDEPRSRARPGRRRGQ